MEPSLFNFATTSHPHARCMGLLAFMHRYNPEVCNLGELEIMWGPVCECLCCERGTER